MAVQTQETHSRSKSKRIPSVEYWLYFSLLFVVLLPTTIVKHAVSLFTGSTPEEGVMRDAMSSTHTAASMIFSV